MDFGPVLVFLLLGLNIDFSTSHNVNLRRRKREIGNTLNPIFPKITTTDKNFVQQPPTPHSELEKFDNKGRLQDTTNSTGSNANENTKSDQEVIPFPMPIITGDTFDGKEIHLRRDKRKRGRISVIASSSSSGSSRNSRSDDSSNSWISTIFNWFRGGTY